MKMRNWIRFVCAGLIAAYLAGPALGQAPTRSAEQIKASFEAHQHQFDFLLGDWSVTLKNARGTTQGYWSAVRLANGQVLDEYRLLTGKGETRLLLTTVRAYNAVLDRWELINMDERNGLQEIGTGHLVGNEMYLEQKVDQMQPGLIRRAKYYDIQPDLFLWTSDLSLDGGKTWHLNVAQIEAKRVGPARTVTLTSEKGPAGMTPVH